MIHTSNIEDKKKAILTRAEWLRRAASHIKRIKPVINQFDGKIYNCRFDEAINALSTDQERISAYNQYGWFYIRIWPKSIYNAEQFLLSGYSCKAENHIKDQSRPECIIFDGKRIKADKMITLLDASYARLNKEAYELEVIAGKLEDRVKQIADTYNLLNRLCGSLPTVVTDICNIKRHYY